MTIKNRPNILLIVLDACRKDKLSCYGYKKDTTPFLTEFCKKSIIFENAFANAPWTLPSVTSIFTGLYPFEHRVLTEKNYLKKNKVTIAKILKEKGYNTTLITHNDCFVNKIYGTANGFNDIWDTERIFFSYIPNFPKLKFKNYFFRKAYSLFNYSLGKITGSSMGKATFNIYKKTIEKTKKPFFINVHLVDTHLPYNPPLKFQIFSHKKIISPQYIPYTNRKLLGFYNNWYDRRQKQWAGLKEYDEKEFLNLNHLYEAAILYSDYQIQRLITLLVENEIIDDTLIIITSDHGENIGDYGTIDHMLDIHNTLLRVPLIIRYPPCFPTYKRNKNLFELKDIYSLIKEIVDSKRQTVSLDSYSKEYVLGNYSVMEHHLNKVKLLNPRKKLYKYGFFILNKEFKYVKYENGDSELFHFNGKEKKLDLNQKSDIARYFNKKLISNVKNREINIIS